MTGEPSIGEITVEEARRRMMAAVSPLPGEDVALGQALGRTLAAPIIATRHQPPFDASAMDGWAMLPDGQCTFRIVGESAAGHPHDGTVAPGEAVRIFTGAPVPTGCAVVVQEQAERSGQTLTIAKAPLPRQQVRARGGDFRQGDVLLGTGTPLDPWAMALAAAAGAGELAVVRRPRVAILSTGEEIIPPGAPILPHQIYNSGGPALAALCQTWGAEATLLPPVGDTLVALVAAVEGLDVDLLVTVGGASVGDHDLVKPALARLGLVLVVDTVKVRPGKPVWFGTLGQGLRVLGLPGNPASALVCAELFLRSLLAAMQGRDPAITMTFACTTVPLAANGARENWMRATLATDAGGVARVTPFNDQDSSLVTVLASANALLKRPIGAGAVDAGDMVAVLPLAHRPSQGVAPRPQDQDR